MMHSVYTIILILAIFDTNVSLKTRKFWKWRKILNKKQSLRVLDGIDDVLNEYPYVVSMGSSRNDPDTYSHGCTGSLIAEQWVLTAAHCVVFEDKGEEPIRIRYGNMTLLPNDTAAMFSNILEIIAHPSYLSELESEELFYIHKNDIALLLVQRVQLQLYGRISAVDYMTLLGLPVKYVGLGDTAHQEILSEEYYQKYDTKHRKFGEAVVVPCEDDTERLICIKPKCSRGSQAGLPGDSGGPLLQGGLIVGVLALYVVFDEDKQIIHNFHTPVGLYLDWISVVMSRSSPTVNEEKH